MLLLELSLKPDWKANNEIQEAKLEALKGNKYKERHME